MQRFGDCGGQKNLVEQAWNMMIKWLEKKCLKNSGGLYFAQIICG
jgi:hypothetical protein